MWYDHESVQFSRSVMSDSLRPHEGRHARSPCPSPTPTVHSDSSPSSQWCHPTVSSSVSPFFSCSQSFPTSESFPLSWLFTSGGQSIGALASASVLPMNIQGWFPLGLIGLILQPKGLSRVFSSTTVQKHQFGLPWLLIRLPVQERQVPSLAQKDPMCRTATNPCATTTESVL